MDISRLSILLIGGPLDQQVGVFDLLNRIEHFDVDVEQATTYEAALALIECRRHDIYLLGDQPGESEHTGLDLLRGAVARGCTAPIILLAAAPDSCGAAALDAGAADYLLVRDLSVPLLERCIRYAIKHARQSHALRAAEERYRTLLENIPLSICEIGIDGRLLAISRDGLRMIGATPEWMSGDKTYLDTIPEHNRPMMALLLARAATGETLEIEYNGMVDQQRRMFAATLMPLADPDGAIRKLLGLTQDITERRQIELDAEMERYRLDAVLESSNDAIVMVDLDSRLVLVNRSFGQFFGLSADEMVGLDSKTALARLVDLVDKPEQFLPTLRSLFANFQREVFGEVEIRAPEYRALIWYSGPVRTRAGTGLGRLFIFRDATREKQADQLKNDFISLVSHELRTPLTSIKGFTDLILEGDAGEISLIVREFLEIVKTCADQLVAITNDILDTARIEAGKIKLELQSISLADVVRRASDLIQPLLANKRQSLTVDLPADLPPVYADPERLVQILTNLLSNAHKYTPEQGRVSLRARLIEEAGARYPAGQAGPQVVISVEDTGIGIAQEDQKLLFTRFYRVHSPETQRVGGTGLGLNITRSLVDLHGGEIWVESAPGRGSTFMFCLPAIVRTPEPAGRSVGMAGGQGTILVVEPDAAIALLICRRLERAGHTVTAVPYPREAIRLARDRRLALITIDTCAGVAILRADPATAAIPIVVISTAEDAERAAELDIAGYLSKPIDERCLVDVVNVTLMRSQRGLVLIVDDSIGFANEIAALLSAQGVDAVIAPDGKQGLTLALKLQPDLVLLDLWMPLINGFEMLNALKQHPATRAIPVIAMTDNQTSPELLTRVRALGAAAIIDKPLDLNVLQALVGRHIVVMEETT